MVADEHDQQAVLTLAIMQSPNLSVDSAQGKIGGLAAKITNWRFCKSHNFTMLILIGESYQRKSVLTAVIR
ncbi:MAG: hypothetical protein ACOYMG_14655, partial [Candidatus Methylumidiphilus sp.]